MLKGGGQDAGASWRLILQMDYDDSKDERPT